MNLHDWLFPRQLRALTVDSFAEIQRFKYVFVVGIRISMDAIYGFFGSFVPRKTVPEPSSHAGPNHPRLMRFERACSSKDGNACISETLRYVYFFDNA